MAQLAIKGHLTRGKEVIEILEMLGGINPHAYRADCDSLCFYIGKGTNIIYYDWVNNCYKDEDTFIFTLEEFLENFPYKIGDRVSSKYLKNYKIEKMEWEDTNNRVIYKLQWLGWYSADELQLYKKETMGKEISGTIIDRFICLEGYDFYDDKGNIIDTKEITMKKKKPQYPKTYDECCEVLGIDTQFCMKYLPHGTFSYKEKLIYNLQELLICRDAYWKLAGDWEPVHQSGKDTTFYAIHRFNNEIIKGQTSHRHSLLEFPNEEMRDAFYENFKELIESCKELL